LDIFRVTYYNLYFFNHQIKCWYHMPDAPILDEYTPELMIDRARGLVPFIRKQAFEEKKPKYFRRNH
jgi:hypothetical protein